MDVPTLMHNLKEEVTCSVCMQLYTDPKQLPCLHIFCLQCLNNVARTSTRNGRIRCPLCQAEVPVPDCGTMESLPDCFYVKNLLDILAIKQCNTSKVTCGNCGEKSEQVSYCFHCGEFWCKICLSGHNIIRSNKEHRVLALKDFNDKDFEDVLKRPAFCAKELHDKQVLKFFCKVCNVPVCQTCVIVDHVGHIVEHLEITAKTVKNNVMIELDSAKSSVKTYSCAVQDLEEKRNKIENCTKATIEKIRQTTQTVIDKLQQFEQNLTVQVEDQGKATLQQLTERNATFQAQLEKHEETISQVEHLIDRSTAAELTRLQSHITKSLQELKAEPPQRSKGEENFTLDFIPNHSFLQSIDSLESTGLGTLSMSPTVASNCIVTGMCNAMIGEAAKIELVTRNSSGEQCYSPADHIKSEFSHLRYEPDFIWKFLDEKNGKYIISLFCRVPGTVQAKFTVNGEPIKQSLFLTVKERSYTSEEMFYSDFRSPWGVTVNASNEIFVTDLNNNKVKVFSDYGQLFRSFGLGLLFSPSGICTDTSGRIYVVDRGNNRILLFDSEGELVKEVGEESMSYGHVQLKEPRGISLDPEGNIIICNSGKSCVLLLSSEGDLLLTFDGSACGLELPFDCLYHEDQIYVSDFKGNSIKIFNKNGDFLFQFGEQGSGDGEFQNPTGLAVDKAGNLLVCDDYNHRVQVFAKDGRFITKFGCYGNEMGQLDKPTGVAVLKDGSIVVAEFGNNRLQLFQN